MYQAGKDTALTKQEGREVRGGVLGDWMRRLDKNALQESPGGSGLSWSRVKS